MFLPASHFDVYLPLNNDRAFSEIRAKPVCRPMASSTVTPSLHMMLKEGMRRDRSGCSKESEQKYCFNADHSRGSCFWRSRTRFHCSTWPKTSLLVLEDLFKKKPAQKKEVQISYWRSQRSQCVAAAAKGRQPPLTLPRLGIIGKFSFSNPERNVFERLIWMEGAHCVSQCVQGRIAIASCEVRWVGKRCSGKRKPARNVVQNVVHWMLDKKDIRWYGFCPGATCWNKRVSMRYGNICCSRVSESTCFFLTANVVLCRRASYSKSKSAFPKR